MPVTLPLAGAQTIREAEDTAQRLRDALAGNDAIILDCGAIDEADLTFLQLVVAARKSAARDGKSVTLMATARGPLLAALDKTGIRPDGEHLFWFEGDSTR